MVALMIAADRLQRLLEAERILSEINREPRSLFTAAELETARQILFVVRRWVGDQIAGA
jgi:hypothetical protein